MWSEVREEIGNSLKRRGNSPMYCSNPQADDVSIARKEAREARAAAERAKKEAERAKRDACDAQWQAYRSCTSSQSTFSAGIAYCRRPMCN